MTEQTKNKLCKHLRGDHVSTYWLCADCFEKLDRRPVEYRMVPTGELCFRNEDGPGATGAQPRRQEISWQASIAMSKEGHSFGKFIMLIAERFVRKGRVDKHDAVDIAIEALKSLADLGDKFGDADFCWDKGAAYEIADEEMSYWDYDGSGGNQ